MISNSKSERKKYFDQLFSLIDENYKHLIKKYQETKSLLNNALKQKIIHPPILQKYQEELLLMETELNH